MPASIYIQWDRRPEEIFLEGYQDYVDTIIAAIQGLCQSYAARIEAWMKQNALWQDQTGNARQALHAEVENLVNGAAIHFGHGVEYGFWLEVIGQGKWGIVAPALDKFAAELWQDVQALFR